MCLSFLTDIIRCSIGGARKCRIVCTMWRGSTRSIRLDKWVAIVMMIILMVAVTVSTSGDWGARGGGAGGGVREGGGEVQALAQLSSWDDRPARGAHPHEQVFAIFTRWIWTISKRFCTLKRFSCFTNCIIASCLQLPGHPVRELAGVPHPAPRHQRQQHARNCSGKFRYLTWNCCKCVLCMQWVKVVWGLVDQCGETTLQQETSGSFPLPSNIVFLAMA